MNAENLAAALSNAAAAAEVGDAAALKAHLEAAAAAVLELAPYDQRPRGGVCVVRGHDVAAEAYIDQHVGKALLLRIYLCPEHTAAWQAGDALELDPNKVQLNGGPVHMSDAALEVLDGKLATMDSRLTEANRTNVDLRQRLEVIERSRPAAAERP